MKKILFVINSLTIGGSEKSLVSLLNILDYDKYDVDLLMLKRGEAFEKYVPDKVNILDIPKYYGFLNSNKIKISTLEKIKYIHCRIKCSIELRVNRYKKEMMNNQQIFYKNQKNILEKLDENYDVAIAYAQGFPTYFVADKVCASKKIAWINCDYTATLYDKKIDEVFYEKFNKIIAVSESGKQSIINVNRKYEKKIEVIKDIVDPKIITKMSEEKIEMFDGKYINILTVARLVMTYKGYDMLVRAAELLKKSNYKFKWYAIGDGPDRKEIEKLIKQYDLINEVILLGSKDNPYSYMKNCDIYVQTSRKEGFGLTVIEAKILKKPIICTGFNSAKEIINDGIDGLIVNINENSIFKGIKRYIEDINFKNIIQSNISIGREYNSINEINKIIKLVED
ncbi:glycosyltransferase [Clostridium sardiniense]|uniref:glycosyltransferase n=1 Tax=Clostridium sardiniense TaxID=29369 RepID=UPI003D347D50